MKWWFLHRDGDDLNLASSSEFPDRPIDANHDDGNPHTPWYTTKEHFDEEHVHVRAPKYETAIKKAFKLINTHP